MKSRLLFIATPLTLLIFSCQIHQSMQESIPCLDRVPEPADMSVRQIVTGRVSTLKEIEIYNVGKNIPYTYSLDKVSNTPGYNWYVSKHFALKTNFTEDDVRLYLQLLEMAYPHYVEIFGTEPPNIHQQRIAVVYSPTRYDAGIAMMDDGFKRGPDGGGETMWYNKVGYNFKSSREHHQRYIILHETCHAFQMAVMDYTGYLPYWFIEGTADALAHHTYDSHNNRLNVMVFDRGCNMDYIRRGLEEYETDGRPTIKNVTLDTWFKRGIGFLIVHFMLDHPLYSHRFKIFRDEVSKLRLSRAETRVKSVEVLQKVFGDWEQVESDFIDFIRHIDKTFNVAGGPWEQDGNSYFVRHYNTDNGVPRLDILLKPGDEPYFKPFKIDQPMPDPCPLIGEVARGVKEPHIGLEVQYLKDHLHRGKIGLGLGLFMPEESRKKWLMDKKRKSEEKQLYDPDDDILYEILIEKGNTLVFDGSDYGADRLAFTLPKKFIVALESQDTPRLGMTVSIGEERLEAALRTGESGQIRFIQSVSISMTVRDQLISRSMAILAQGANHQITPYFDDGRDLNPNPPDYEKSTPCNAFQNPIDKEITRLVHAVVTLGQKTPDSVSSLTSMLLEATDEGPEKLKEAELLLQNERENLAADLASLESSSPEARPALQAFAGTAVRLEWEKKLDDEKRPVRMVIDNPSDLPVQADLDLNISLGRETIDQISYSIFSIKPNSTAVLYHIAPPYDDDRVLCYTVHGHIQWAGQQFDLVHTEADPFPWSSMQIIEPAQIEGDEIKIAALLRGPFSGDSEGKLTIEVMPAGMTEESIYREDVLINPKAVKKFLHSFKIKEGIEISDCAVNVRFDMNFEGEPVCLEERSFVTLD